MAFLSDSLKTLTVRVVLIGVNLAGGIINARWLGPEGIGLLALVTLMQSFTFRFANLGFGSSFAFFVARSKARLQTVFTLACLLAAILSGISCLAIVLGADASFSPWQSLPTRILLLGLGTVLPFFLLNFLQRICSGLLDIRSVNQSEVIRTAIHLPTLTLTVIVLAWGVAGAVAAIIASEIAVSLFLMYRIMKRFTGHPKGTAQSVTTLLGDMLHYGKWNYLIMFVNFFLEDLPLIALSKYATPQGIGLFSLGRNLTKRIRIIPEAFSKVLFPYTAASEDRTAVRRTNAVCRNFLVISLLLAGALACIIKPLIILMYGEAFAFAATIYYLLIPAIVCWPVSQFLTTHIAAVGNPRTVFWFRLAAIPACALCSFTLAPRYAAVGAALSVSATYVIIAALCVIAYTRAYNVATRDVLLLQAEDLTMYGTTLKKLSGRLGASRQ